MKTRVPGKSGMAAVLLFLSVAHGISRGNDNDALQANKAKAISAAQSADYSHLITQHARSGKQPDPQVFHQWILDEINNDSVMRDQIGDEIALIQDNGRNGNHLTFYYTRDKEYRGRLVFMPDDLTVELVGGKDGLYEYKAVLRARDNYRRGHTMISFHFAFRAKVEYFKFTKAYQITVVSYPTFLRKEEKDQDYLSR